MSNMQLGEDTITMSMTLNPVNEAAFQKAAQSLETGTGPPCSTSDTGTGKAVLPEGGRGSPQTTFSGWWPVHSVRSLRQAELTRYNGGNSPARQCPLL